MATRTQSAAAKKRAEAKPGTAVETSDKTSRVLARRSIGSDFPLNLDGFTDLDALRAAIAAAGIEVGTVEGADKLVEIESLEGVPFIAVDWRVIESDKYTNPDGSPAEFVAVTVVAAELGRVVFTTGAFGIVQAIKLAQSEGLALFDVPQGVKRSEFVTTGARGERIEATSWWLN